MGPAIVALLGGYGARYADNLGLLPHPEPEPDHRRFCIPAGRSCRIGDLGTSLCRPHGGVGGAALQFLFSASSVHIHHR